MQTFFSVSGTKQPISHHYFLPSSCEDQAVWNVRVGYIALIFDFFMVLLLQSDQRLWRLRHETNSVLCFFPGGST